MNTFMITNDDPISSQLENQRTSFFIRYFANQAKDIRNFEVKRFNINKYLLDFSNGQKLLPFAGDIEFSLILNHLIDSNSPEIANDIASLSRADLLIVDNCYLWPLAKKVRDLNQNIAIVYISHNAEYELKKIVSNLEGWPIGKATEYLEFVKINEKSCLQQANLTICCSNEDAGIHKFLGSQNVLVLPNGAFKYEKSHKNSNDVLEFLGCEKFILYVASGHPPNVHGFLEGVGVDFGFMPPGTRIVIVGSCSKYIEQRILNSKYKETFLNRGSVIPFAEKTLLAKLYRDAKAVILPIFEGGGTNIKTAEAFLNSRKIISTSFAQRGFEFSNFDKFNVVEKDDFRKNIKKLLEDDENSNEPIESSNEYSWEWIMEKYSMLLDNEFSRLQKSIL